MREVTALTVGDYLRDARRARADEQVTAEELSGGVSNMVLRVRCAASGGSTSEFVIKQARPQLRVAQTWLCSVERNWREIDFLRACARIATSSPACELCMESPRVLWEDRENYLFAMTAVPAESVTWKSRLLEFGAGIGDVEFRVARACGAWLGRLHGGSWRDVRLAREFGDRSLFDALRLDPYYRGVAAVHLDMAGAMESLIASVEENCVSLVHADFSPKNMLVRYGANGGEADDLALIDFETGHFGDPAFDVGFFLSHLALKTFYCAGKPRASAEMLQVGDAFYETYRVVMTAAVGEMEFASLMRRSMKHIGACALARLDGKSPVDYLCDHVIQDKVRRWARWLTIADVGEWDAARDSIARSA